MGEDYVHAKVTPRFSEILSLEAQNQTFQNASDMIRRLFHVEISANTIRKVAENIGNKLYEEDEILEMTHEQVDAEIAKDRGYVQIDGAMINHRDDGWKENKLAIFFFFKNIVRSGKELNERITIKKKQLVSSFAQGLEPFSARFHKYLIKSKIFQAREIVIISDGATWISNLVEKFLPKCTHILDWFHAKEKLWDCAKLLYGEKSPKVKPWVEYFSDMLWNGQEEKMLREIFDKATSASKKYQTPLFNLYNYLNSRLDKIHYKKFRDKGYYIGSGAIESANKYAIQDRLKKAGMQWSTRGGNAIAKLRTMNLSDQWDEFWNYI